jgi:hypothetical protein
MTNAVKCVKKITDEKSSLETAYLNALEKLAAVRAARAYNYAQLPLAV